MKITPIVIVLFITFISTACKKADEYIADKIHEERVELANRGILPVSWTEERVEQFYADHKGKSLDRVTEVLGRPRYRWDNDSKITIHYVIEGKVNNPKVGIDFSGFSLDFEDNKLVNIGMGYGHQS